MPEDRLCGMNYGIAAFVSGRCQICPVKRARQGVDSVRGDAPKAIGSARTEKSHVAESLQTVIFWRDDLVRHRRPAVQGQHRFYGARRSEFVVGERNGMDGNRERRHPGRSIVSFIVASQATAALVSRQLTDLDTEIHLTTRFGEMAETLFDKQELVPDDRKVLFVLDLRISCGETEIAMRLRDYDAVLNAYVLSGRPWPRTLCLVEAEQTHPTWMQARPHLRATLLADEVETVIGQPHEMGWGASFALALRCCLRD